MPLPASGGSLRIIVSAMLAHARRYGTTATCAHEEHVGARAARPRFVRSRAFASSLLALALAAGVAPASAVEPTVLSISGASLVDRAANLLTNGSFETAPTGDYWGPSANPTFLPGNPDFKPTAPQTTVPSWTATGGGWGTYADYSTCAGGASIPNPWRDSLNNAATGNTTAYHGTRCLYLGNGYIGSLSLSSGTYSFNALGELQAVVTSVNQPGTDVARWGDTNGLRLAQTFTTVPGRTYRLGFAAGGFETLATWPRPGLFAVDLTGYDRKFLEAPAEGAGSTNWRYYVLQFTATAASTTVTFINWGHLSVAGGNSNEIFLDDVVANVMPAPRLDVVKSVGAVSQVNATTFDVPYTVRVGNTGTTTAPNVQVNDSLATAFASGSPTLSITSAPAVTRGSCTANAAFNGNADTRLLAGTDTFAASAACTITFTVRVTYASLGVVPATAQNNSAYASSVASAPNAGYTFGGGGATAPASALATDQSTNGASLPATANGDVASPTPVTFSQQRIDIVLAAQTPTRVSATVFDVVYTAVVGNNGTVSATNVQANDYLPTTFASGSPTLSIASAPAVTAGACTVNPAFNGNADTRLLAGTDTFAVSATCTVRFTVRVTYPSASVVPTGTLNNTAYASTAASGPNAGYTFPGGSATAPVAALATDTSTDGGSLPGTANGDTPTPTPVTLPATSNAALSGYVWLDGNRDRVRQPGETIVPGFAVEIVNAATGAVIPCTSSNTPAGASGCVSLSGRSLFVTDATGRYAVTGLAAGSYQVRFRDPANNVIFATPVNGSNDAASRVDSSGAFIAVTLGAGANVVEQSLPLDPSGVVYNAVTRQPVTGATVRFCGPGGFNAETMLVGTGYSTSANCASLVTGSLGSYQFWLAQSAPPGTYTLSVTPPAGFIAPSQLIPAQSIALTPPVGPGRFPVQAQSTAPTGTDPTTYYLAFNLAPGARDVVNNHIPVDPVTGNALFVTKTASAQVVELGDSLAYTVTVRNPTVGSIANVVLADRLPLGFRYIGGTARVGNAAVADPAGAPGPALNFALGTLPGNTTVTVTYRVRVGVGAQQGDGINRAAASGSGGITSNVATARVRVGGGVFTDEACVIGKIFVDCNGNSIQDAEEIGIPGVRLYFSDGTYLISDSEGKYSYCGLRPRTHTFKVDRLTLPRGSRLTTSSNRNALDAGSLFLDLKSGELHQADFIEGSCSPDVVRQVKARRAQGEVRAPETERQDSPALIFDSRPNGVDTSNQRAPRPRYEGARP